MKAAIRITIVLFILSLLSLYVVIYAVPRLTGALTKTEVLEYGNLKITDDAVCYFIRNETVYSAARVGSINYFIGDAVHVKRGTRILSIVAGRPDESEVEERFGDIVARLGEDAVRTPDNISEFNGITSYFIDGYENYFTKETMHELKYERVSKLETEPINVVRDYTFLGQPLYKICDNREWFLACWVGPGNISKYERGRNVTIELPLGQIRAQIEDIIEDGSRWLILFRTDRYYEEFGRVRSAEAKVIVADYNGVLIRNSSITAEDGVIGVYIRSRSGEFVFRPVKIITADGSNSLVEVSYFYDEEGGRVSTVNIFDEILINP